MTNTAKKILNSLKCPICRSPIDITGYPVFSTTYNYGCAYNCSHYMLSIITLGGETKIEKERVSVFDKTHKYEISKTYRPNGNKTEIIAYQIDPEGRVIFSFKNHQLNVEQEIFNFSNFNPDKALNRIKTLFVFQ
jgi:hypothetical protein